MILRYLIMLGAALGLAGVVLVGWVASDGIAEPLVAVMAVSVVWVLLMAVAWTLGIRQIVKGSDVALCLGLSFALGLLARGFCIGFA